MNKENKAEFVQCSQWETRKLRQKNWIIVIIVYRNSYKQSDCFIDVEKNSL